NFESSTTSTFLGCTSSPGRRPGWAQDSLGQESQSRQRAQPIQDDAQGTDPGPDPLQARSMPVIIEHALVLNRPPTRAAGAGRWHRRLPVMAGGWKGGRMTSHLKRACWASLLLAACLPPNLLAQNLLINPGFDTSLAGWDNGGYSTWDGSHDADGNPSSG